MSDKRKIKQKRKRGPHGASINIVTSLSPEACVERLASSPSPLDGYDTVRVNAAYMHLTIRFSPSESRVTAPVWFAGDFKETSRGTRIKGTVYHEYHFLSEKLWLFVILFALMAGIVFLDDINVIPRWITFSYFGVLMLIVIPAFFVLPEIRVSDQEAVANVSQWLHSELE